MRSLRANCLAIALAVCSSTLAHAAEPAAPEAAYAFAGVGESLLLTELSAGRLRTETLFEAALVAQGTANEQQLDRSRARFATHRQTLQGRFSAGTTSAQRARGAYEYLHTEILTGQYITDCSDLNLALARGDYNCLSATVLYMALCQGLAVPVEAVARPGHVYCRLVENGEAVETTCPQWFSLTTEQRHRAIGPRVAASAASPSDRSLSSTQLVAKVYYNRGLAEMERRAFPAAIAHFSLAARLDPHDGAARENVLAATNNGALALGDAGQWAQAAELVLRGRRIDSAYAPLVANDLHIHRQWLLQLARQGSDAQAAAILTELAQRQHRPELVREWSRELGIEISPATTAQPAGF